MQAGIKGKIIDDGIKFSHFVHVSLKKSVLISCNVTENYFLNHWLYSRKSMPSYEFNL